MKTIAYQTLSAILCLALINVNFRSFAQQSIYNFGRQKFVTGANGPTISMNNDAGLGEGTKTSQQGNYNGTDATFVNHAADDANMPGFSTTPFSCTAGVVWQVTGSPTSKLSSYNVNTGLTTVVASLSYEVNGLGYNETDGMMWGCDVNTSGNLLRIDATGSVTSFTISHLPTGNYYDVGVELPGGFLLVTEDNINTYYVIDINPSSANYLKLVNPANTSVAQSGTYGKSLGAVLNCNDLAYDPVNGLVYGVGSPGTTDQYKLISLNPSTGAVTKSTSKVTGSTIQSETLGYGSTYFDPSGILYVFADLQGKFYSVNVSTFTAALVSNSTAAQNNDGANCPGAFLSYLISGTVYADANGLNDNTVNGTGTNAGGTLTAVLYDNTAGIVANTATVASNGTYSLPATPGDSYTVYLLSSSVPTVGSTSTPTPSLSSGWVNTGEFLGSSTGNDGTANGVLPIGAVNAATSNANFGIDSKPTGTSSSNASQPNPNGGGAAAVSSTVFNGTDAEDGTYSGNLTGRTVTLNAASGGTLYYNGVAVTSSTTITSFDPTKISLDPTSTGATSPTFTYQVQDNASVFSSNITVTVPFTTPSRAISGTIWDDANSDAVKGTGESFTNAGGSIYVNLVSTSTGKVVQSVLADATTGAYSLGGLTNTAYKIILTTTSQATGNALSASTIPPGWIATGVNINGVASTSNLTGIITVASGTGAVTNQNFGVEQTPSASNVNTTYNNPGTTITVTAPTLQGSDPEDQAGTGSLAGKIVKVQSLPASGTLYYNGTAVTAGQTISGYTPSLLTFDPPNGAGSYTFNFSYVDNSGQASPAATATITIQCTSISISALASRTLFCASSSPITLTSTPVGGVTPYASFAWTGSGLTANNTQNTSATPTASNTYNVTVTDAAGCTATAGVNVTYDAPAPSVAQNCYGTSYQLTEINGSSWLWSTTSGGRFYPDASYSVLNDSDVSHLEAPYIKTAGSYTVQITDGNGCQGGVTFTVSFSGCTVLSSNQLNVNATRQGNAIYVKWSAGNETGVKQYTVERSEDAQSYTTAGNIIALNTGSHNYNFTDDVSFIECKTLYYRIKQVNNDGSSNYSSSIMVKCNSSDASQYVLQVSPNPLIANQRLLLTYTVPAGINKVQVMLTNILGQQVYNATLHPANGVNTVPISINNIAGGNYLLRLVGDKWVSKTVQIATK